MLKGVKIFKSLKNPLEKKLISFDLILFLHPWKFKMFR